MLQKALVAVALIAVAALLVIPGGAAATRQRTEVFITNWPPTQQVEGKVAIEGPIQSAAVTRIQNVIVSPVRPGDTTRWIDAGTLQTAGYPWVVLSLVGQVKGSVAKPGVVGLVLLPTEEAIQRAFNEEGRVLFPLEVESEELSRNFSFFRSNQPRYPVAFPEYRVLLYNTSDKSVEVDLVAYLTN